MIHNNCCVDVDLPTHSNESRWQGPKLERYADKMREMLPLIGWLLLLYLVCVLCQSTKLNQTVTL